MQLIVKGRLHLRLPFLIECGEVYLLCNKIAGFVGEHYHWKEPIDVFDFCIELIVERSWHLKLPFLLGFS